MSNSIKRIVVAEAQVPFVRGGAELHVQALIDQLRDRGDDVEKVAIPFRSQPKSELLAQAAAWRLLDLSSSNGEPIDLFIATRFPTYLARHPRKVAWVIHQHRAAYELVGTPYSDFEDTAADVGLRQRLVELDARMLGECHRVFANARNTANRMAKFNGVQAQALYHPPALAPRLHGGRFDNYLLAVGRLETVKRVDLAIRALAQVPAPARLAIVGDGTQRRALEQLAAATGVSARVTFAGSVGDDELVRLYADARAVIYAPFDEDFGYVTLEAFLSGKPVITADDSGGTLEFVVDGTNGFVCSPSPESLAGAIARVAGDEGLARRLGSAGQARARTVTWDGVVEQLLADPATVSVIIPAMNEDRAIGSVVSGLHQAARWREILVIDDGSSDATGARASDAGARVIRHPYNKGNGAAVKTGIRNASGEFVLIIDADGQHVPADALRLVSRLGEYDLVVGARHGATQATTARRGGNALLNWLASYLTGREIPDLTSGFRGARLTCLREFLHLLPNGFSTPTTTTLAFIKAGYNVAFEPIEAKQREGASKIRLARDGAKFFLILLKIVTIFSPLRIFVPISAAAFTAGAIYGIWNAFAHGRIPNGAVLLVLFAVVVFLVGLVSEQIATLRFEGPRP